MTGVGPREGRRLAAGGALVLGAALAFAALGITGAVAFLLPVIALVYSGARTDREAARRLRDPRAIAFGPLLSAHGAAGAYLVAVQHVRGRPETPGDDAPRVSYEHVMAALRGIASTAAPIAPPAR